MKDIIQFIFGYAKVDRKPKRIMKRTHNEPIDMDFYSEDKIWDRGWKAGFISGMVVTAIIAACFLIGAVIATMKAIGG